MLKILRDLPADFIGIYSGFSDPDVAKGHFLITQVGAFDTN